MLVVTAPLAYYDTYAYASAGRTALARLIDVLPPRRDGDRGRTRRRRGGGTPPSRGRTAGAGTASLRSAPWAISLVLLGGLPWGAVALCILQTAATLLVLRAALPIPGAAPGGTMGSGGARPGGS